MAAIDDKSFWDFSVRTYRQRGVADACIALQDERGVDVNLLLFCLWTGATRGPFDDQIFESALTFSRLWSDNVVAALRDVRRWMKVDGCSDTIVATDRCMSLRDEVKQVEFKAERLQEDTLEALCDDWPVTMLSESEGLQHAVANSQRYFSAASIPIDEHARGQLQTIILAAIPGADPAAIQAALAGS